jgi:hypothetical protein
MRVLLALWLMLLAPATALAREPVISYVDAGGTFRLWDEELNAEVSPPPPVPANFAGFRYGMSHQGRYIVFNDAQKKLHLLDRATNTEVPLPGIDVYTNPGGLSVSDNGLISFDDNSNGPAVVYSSAAGAFVETGLAADNGHRQTRLSGDGRFLATTCVDPCIVDSGGDADPYVQDLTAKADTAFPDDNARDEEHPCIDADGSLVGLDKGPAGDRDIHLFDRSVTPPQAVLIPGVNEATREEAYCQLDGAGDYLGFSDFVNGGFMLYDVKGQALVTLPPGKEFDNRSMLSAPYSPPAPGGGGGGNTTTLPPPDVTRPVARRARMTRRRLRPGRRVTFFRFVLSEPADVRIRIRRRGRTLRTITRRGRSAGANSIRFDGRARGRALRPGRYTAVLAATDAAGNVSRPRALRFRVLRGR